MFCLASSLYFPAICCRRCEQGLSEPDDPLHVLAVPADRKRPCPAPPSLNCSLFAEPASFPQRYMLSPPSSATRMAWTHTHITAEKYCPAALRGALATVSGFLGRMVHIDPQQQQ